jgi:lipopolysaccharide export system protein LptA
VVRSPLHHDSKALDILDQAMPSTLPFFSSIQIRSRWIQHGLIACALAFSHTTLHAERADRDQPVHFEANQAQYDDFHQQYTLTGAVVLTQGSTLIHSEKAILRLDAEGYSHAEAIGTPSKLATLRQKRDGLNEFIEGIAEKITYNGKTEVAVLERQARIKRLENGRLADDIQSNRIIYDARQATYAAETNNPTGGERVKAILAPRQKRENKQQP